MGPFLRTCSQLHDCSQDLIDSSTNKTHLTLTQELCNEVLWQTLQGTTNDKKWKSQKSNICVSHNTKGACDNPSANNMSHSPGSNGKSCERQVSGYKTWKSREIDWVTVFTIIIIQKDMTQIRTDVKETIST